MARVGRAVSLPYLPNEFNDLTEVHKYLSGISGYLRGVLQPTLTEFDHNIEEVNLNEAFITDLTETESPDPDNCYVMVYDYDAGEHRKVSLTELVACYLNTTSHYITHAYAWHFAGELEVADSDIIYRAERDETFNALIAQCPEGDGPSGADLEFDIELNGVSIFSTKPEIDDGETEDDGNHVFGTTALEEGDELVCKVTQTGDASNLTVQLHTLEVASGSPPNNIWRHYAGVPPDTLGSNGDYCLDTDNKDIYYKSEGSWGDAIVSLDVTPNGTNIIVAKSGGDYSSVQDALDSVTDAAADNRYVIVIYPGTYEEEVTMKEYVSLVGVDRDAVTISASGGTGVVSANHARISDLTIDAGFGVDVVVETDELLLNNVKASSSEDCLYFGNSSNSRVVVAINCDFELTGQYGVTINKANVTLHGFNCRVYGTGSIEAFGGIFVGGASSYLYFHGGYVDISNTLNNGVVGVNVVEGEAKFFGTRIRCSSTGNQTVKGVSTSSLLGSTPTTHLIGCSVTTSGGSSHTDLYNGSAGSTLGVLGTFYSSSSGTITSLDALVIEDAITLATAETDPEDADLFGTVVSAALKKVTWSTIKSTLKTYFDTLYGDTKIKTGTYTGDGTEGQGITGVGFQPKYVKIWTHQGAAEVYEKVDQSWGDYAFYHGTLATHEHNWYENRINSLDADGFTVDDGGSDAHPNKNGTTYDYLALG